MKQLAVLLMLLPAAAGAASTTEVPPPARDAVARLDARPLADNSLPSRDRVEFLHFVVNSDHGRAGRKVGAELEVCKPRWGSDDDCTTMDYYFPGLSFDAATLDVKWGNEVVEHRGSWLWNHVESPAFRLACDVKPVEWTNGFDSGTRYVYSVFLQKLATK